MTTPDFSTRHEAQKGIIAIYFVIQIQRGVKNSKLLLRAWENISLRFLIGKYYILSKENIVNNKERISVAYNTREKFLSFTKFKFEYYISYIIYVYCNFINIVKIILIQIKSQLNKLKMEITF